MTRTTPPTRWTTTSPSSPAATLLSAITGVLAAAIVFTAIVGSGLLSGDEDAIFITSTVGTAVAALVGVLSIPGLFAAYGLFKRRTWGGVS
jgi:hypothetical protein